MNHKCCVKNCTNYSSQGTFVNNIICLPCYNILTTGKGNPTNSILNIYYYDNLIKRLDEEIFICEAYNDNIYRTFINRRNDKEFLETNRLLIRQIAGTMRKMRAFLKRYGEK